MHAFEPVVEPAELRLVQLDGRIGTKIDIPSTTRRRAGVGEQVRPGPYDEFLVGPGLGGPGVLTQATEVRQDTAQEDVIPRGDVIHGNVDIGVLPLAVDRPPVGTVLRMAQVVGQVTRYRA